MRMMDFRQAVTARSQRGLNGLKRNLEQRASEQCHPRNEPEFGLVAVLVSELGRPA